MTEITNTKTNTNTQGITILSAITKDPNPVPFMILITNSKYLSWRLITVKKKYDNCCQRMQQLSANTPKSIVD